MQRKLKDAGRFVFIDRVRGNPGFLVSIPASLRYVREALARRPDLGTLQAILAATCRAALRRLVAGPFPGAGGVRVAGRRWGRWSSR